MSLDFEKPIIKLEEKLTQIKELASKSGKNLDDEALSIEKKINDLKKDIFSKLTRWQKVQLSRHPNRPYFLDYIYKMTDEFIREVDEDVKEEKRLKLWKKFFPYVVSISLGIVLFTSGFVFWEGYSNTQRQKMGDDFTAAVVLAGEDDLDASLLALDRIVDNI